MFVRDIYADAVEVLGKCSEPDVFRRLTDAVRVLANKSRWNPTLGFMDVCTSKRTGVNGGACVTLPREVKTVLGVAVGGAPTYLTDAQWYAYHLNGPGVQDCVPCGFSQIAGTFCTIRDPAQSCYVIAKLRSAADNSKRLRVYAFRRDGERIFTPNETTGQMEEGFLVPTIFGYPAIAPDVPPLARIYRIDKEETQDFVELIAVNEALQPLTLLGRYEPDETEPAYQRISVPQHAWVRVHYQKKNLEIVSQNDWINLDDRIALLMALKSVKFRLNDRDEEADKFEATAQRLMTENQASLENPGVKKPQIVNSDTFQFESSNSQMFYAGGTGYPGWAGGGN
jgi:hypothetical protein